MRIGIDSSVIIAAVHANHPLHPVSSGWLSSSLERHELIVAHHSLLEAYAVLTRLPGDLKVSPTEARDILRGTVHDNMKIAGFQGSRVWEIIESISGIPAIGGQAYDAFIMEIIKRNNVDAFATFNSSHFKNLRSGIKIIDPAQPNQHHPA